MSDSFVIANVPVLCTSGVLLAETLAHAFTAARRCHAWPPWSRNTNKAGVLFGTANVLAVTAVDIMCAQELSREKGSMTEHGAIRFKSR